jgi:hypothetical protein
LAETPETDCQAQIEERTVANEKELEALRLTSRSLRAITQLEAHKKSVTGEYNERIKRLKKVIDAVQARDQLGVLPLEGIDGVCLTEDDERLILNPVEGL